MSRPIGLALAPIAAGLVAVAVALAPGASAAARAPAAHHDAPVSPTVVVSATGVPTGAMVTVALAGWPAGVVTISVCGDEARRGSVDCDQIGSRGVGIPPSGAASARLVVSPPVGCPCVVRVSTPSSELVRTVPIDVSGVARLSDAELGPVLLPAVAASPLEVEARLEAPSGGSSLVAAFGGPVDRQLVLTVRNVGPVPVAGVSISGAVGRHPGEGEPVTMPPLGTLGPGEERTVSVAVTIPAFAVGHHVVSGRVDSMGGAARFAIASDVEPWGLLAAVALVLSFLVVLRVRSRSRRRARRRDEEAPLVAHAPQGRSAAAGLGRLGGPPEGDRLGRAAHLGPAGRAAHGGGVLADDLVRELVGVAGLDVPLPPGAVGVGHPGLDLGGVAAD
ncbi:MAG: hypothetical protein ACXV95_02560, partial [Acidimicrobiales bacterium]